MKPFRRTVDRTVLQMGAVLIQTGTGTLVIYRRLSFERILEDDVRGVKWTSSPEGQLLNNVNVRARVPVVYRSVLWY